MELNQNGDKIACYAYGPNVDEPIFMVRSGASYFYQTDHLGSIRVLTDSNENIVATYQYDVFGTILQEVGSVNNSYRFTGREWDAESGLYYYRARYYDAVLGRFLQKDPIERKEKPNLYPYVENNPINYVDPTGKWGLKPCCKEGPKLWGHYLWCTKHGHEVVTYRFDSDEFMTCIGTSFVSDYEALTLCLYGVSTVCLYVCKHWLPCGICLGSFCGRATLTAIGCARSAIMKTTKCV
jgi:RHS repeat-associated protein